MNSPFEQYGVSYIADKPEISSAFTISGSDNNLAIGGDCPDLILLSSDQAFYHVHRLQILSVSSNAFAGMAADNNNTTITLTEPATVLDPLVHIIYGISCIHLAPSFETTEATLIALIKYGIPLQLNAFPGQPLYQLLLLHAPHRPIDAYALAGHHGLEEAAVAISGHLLAYDSSRLSDTLVAKMGPVYFYRLLCLHQNRLSALKNILLRPPAQHPPTPECAEDARGRAQITEAWGYAVAQLVWDVSPAISTSALRRTFENTGGSSVCCKCHAMLQARIGEVCEAWAAVKRTI